jgi:hypothetical protein
MTKFRAVSFMFRVKTIEEEAKEVLMFVSGFSRCPFF